MLDKKQVAINSILELNEDNVKMKITLTVEGLAFQYSGGSIKRETFFQQNKKSFSSTFSQLLKVVDLRNC